MSGLRAGITGYEDVVTVRLSGELCGFSAPLLESVLHRLEARRPALLILDLRGLTPIDLSGAGLVRRAGKRARLAGRSFALISDSERSEIWPRRDLDVPDVARPWPASGPLLPLPSRDVLDSWAAQGHCGEASASPVCSDFRVALAAPDRNVTGCILVRRSAVPRPSLAGPYARAS
jgi:anti-anti-sigma factor